MKLYLMRHGQAASIEADPQQGLSNEGKAGIEQLAHRLSRQGVTFKQVFHSEKARAQQTAEIMTNILSPDVAPTSRTNLKPNDDPEKLLPDIDTWQEDTLIASHLPFIPHLLMLLTNDNQASSFTPGTIACLTKNGSKWQLEWISRP
jgi:phosphohistidine phosphatase